MKPREPISAITLRRVVIECRDIEPGQRRGVLLALRACSDGLAPHELPPEVREFRDVVEEYTDWLATGKELRQRVKAAAAAAIPWLDELAADNEEALDVARSEEERAAGKKGTIWPSADSLRQFPQALMDVLPREDYIVSWLHKILHDISLTSSDHRVITHYGPTKTRIAKALALAGYKVAQIATITEPTRGKGAERRQALNTVRNRLKSKRDDHLHPLEQIAADDPRAAEKMAELEDIVDFVAGVSSNVSVYDRSPWQFIIESEDPDEG